MLRSDAFKVSFILETKRDTVPDDKVQVRLVSAAGATAETCGELAGGGSCAYARLCCSSGDMHPFRDQVIQPIPG